MIVLNDWHKDISKFINAKRDMSLITGANISVGVSDEFMEAKKAGGTWNLGHAAEGTFEKYEKEYEIEKEDFVVTDTVNANDIWDEMMFAARYSAEPGIIFMTRYNKISNSYYFNPVIATNPLKWNKNLNR